MVKIKDFTLVSKNLGACAPVPYTTPVHEYSNLIGVALTFIVVLLELTGGGKFGNYERAQVVW